VELPQTSLEFCIELRPAGAPLRVKLREALLQLRVEPTEVQLVQLAQISAIGRVYIVEPGHELGSDLLAQDLVEPLGQFRGDRHALSPLRRSRRLRSRVARASSKPCGRGGSVAEHTLGGPAESTASPFPPPKRER